MKGIKILDSAENCIVYVLTRSCRNSTVTPSSVDAKTDKFCWHCKTSSKVTIECNELQRMKVQANVDPYIRVILSARRDHF
mmetsp:Transcript_31192/g.45622  ORF Transcript_31192/g.45622 Transcript_31192/m.45622 type:complete len:81 (-) Transcript_31192:722-964(-)